MSAAVPPPAAMTDEEERLLGRVELTSESAFLRLRGISFLLSFFLFFFCDIYYYQVLS
jgi:hypothetical protein